MKPLPLRLLSTSLLCSLLAPPAQAGIFTVTTTADSLLAPPIGSLRWAIQRAVATPGPDTIVFAIPGPGVHTIVLQGPLPPLTDPAGTFIDGLSQPGASAGGNPPSTATLLIELVGHQAGAATGITCQSDNNTVQGLVINRFSIEGIHVLGGPTQSANRNRIYCNFVGTDPTGTVGLGNGSIGGPLRGGIHVGNVPGGIAVDNTIERNLSSANWSEGIWIEGPRAPGDVGFNHVLDNYVGTDVSGTADLGNHHEGIALTEGTHDNDVRRNLASGNDTDGIGLQGFDNFGLGAPIHTRNNLIEANLVGVDVNINPLPNTMRGIAVGLYGPGQWGYADRNRILRNVVAHNGGAGIAVYEAGFLDTTNADHNRISRNAIWANAGLGIDLGDDGVTFDDPGDLDPGANQQLNFPVITGVVYNVTSTTISGNCPIDSPPAQATVEVFAARADPSVHGEGRWYLGSTTPDVAGNWTLTTNALVPGDLVTATATDSFDNTSEFAANAVVPGTAALTIDEPLFPARLGGVVNFTLDAGPARANRLYLVVGSMTGTAPGTPLGSVTVPLVADLWTNIVLAWTNSPTFSNFFANLDGNGRASAQMDLRGLLGPSWAGARMHYAFVLFPFDYASNPVTVQATAW